MIFTKWIGQRDITTIYGMRPSKLDEEMLLDMLWCIAKATKRFKNETRKCRKKIFSLKRIETTLLLWQQWTMVIFHLFLFL